MLNNVNSFLDACLLAVLFVRRTSPVVSVSRSVILASQSLSLDVLSISGVFFLPWSAFDGKTCIASEEIKASASFQVCPGYSLQES